MTARYGWAAKAVCSLALLGILAWSVDLRQLPERLGTLAPGWIAVAGLAVLAAIGVSVMKWGLILARRGHALPMHRLARLYLVGLFFNNLMPGTVGGDAVRAWATTRETGEVPEAVASVVTERLVAGAGLGLTAALGLMFLPEPGRFVVSVAIFLTINFALIGLLLIPGLTDGAVRTLLPKDWRSSTTRTLAAVQGGLRDPRITVPVLALSILFQSLVAAVNAALFAGLGVPVDLGACLILTPMIFALTMLPFSLSGFGLREAAYAYFFAFVGVSAADAVAVSLAFFGIVALASLPGAPLFFLSGTRRALQRQGISEAQP